MARKAAVKNVISGPLEIDDGERCRIILLGAWRVTLGEQVIQYDDADIYHCIESDRIAPLVHLTRANWIVVGKELDDGEIQQALSNAKVMREDLRFAILGPRHDWRRCERWLRRGCRAYLEDSTSLDRVVAALHTAQRLEVNVTDRTFFQTLQERAVGSTPQLTRREREVLDLLRRGLRNREIARALHVTENTVEYHMRHLLAKFSARSRLEVVERASALGLA